MTDVDIWRVSAKTIDKSRKYYAHFDYRTDISKCWSYISNPSNISKHAFYPFIHYTKKTNKWKSGKGRIFKERDIAYASHIDRCIFQYYNFILNNLYNAKCKALGIDDTAVAYRNNLSGQSNIHFAKKAISFIKGSGSCYIMIGDFTKFFDNLDHKYLKSQWSSLLGKTVLPADHYSVFKNITRYSMVDLKELLKLHKLDNNTKGRRSLNSMTRVLSPMEFRKIKSLLRQNEFKGIPQGSPLSGVLANIYMLEADTVISRYVSTVQGLYMRYSDDFIIILPNVDESLAVDKLRFISKLLNDTMYPGLELQPNKTQYYHYHYGTLNNCGKIISFDVNCANAHLNFLGFRFNGEKVFLRDKTVSKYYQRMRRKAKTIVRSGGYTKKGKHISKKNLYIQYSERGAFSKKGNFLSYAHRALAPNQFGADAPINLILKRNMKKVRLFLKKDYM